MSVKEVAQLEGLNGVLDHHYSLPKDLNCLQVVTGMLLCGQKGILKTTVASVLVLPVSLAL